MQASPAIPHPRQRGFTLIELLASVAICAVLASLLYPLSTSMTRKSQAAACVSNLRQIGAGLHAYATDNNNNLPIITEYSAEKKKSVDWDQGSISTYIPLRADGRQNKIFICPAAKYKGWPTSDLSRAYSASDCLMGINPSTGNIAFTFSEYGRNRMSIANPASSILLYDGVQDVSNRFCPVVNIWSKVSGAQDLKTTSGPTTYLDFRHNDTVQALYADGHVGAIARKDSKTITKSVWQGL